MDSNRNLYKSYKEDAEIVVKCCKLQAKYFPLEKDKEVASVEFPNTLLPDILNCLIRVGHRVAMVGQLKETE